MMVGERATLLESKIPRKLRSANNPRWVRYLVGETVKNDYHNLVGGFNPVEKY